MPFSRRSENILLAGIKIPLSLIPFIPLIVSVSMPFPFITGKNFAFRILVELSAAFWLVLMAVNRDLRPRNSPLAISVLVFTFIVGLADMFGINPYRSFWSNLERMEGYITILHLALYFLILKSVMKTKKEWIVFLRIFLLASVLVGICAFTFDMGDTSLSARRYIMEYGARFHSTIGNPPFLASYLLLSIFTGLILMLNTEKAYLKTCYVVAVLFLSLVVYITGSRGAILAGMTGIILYLFFYGFFIKKFNRKEFLKVLSAASIAVLMIVSAIFVAFEKTDFVPGGTLHRFSLILSDSSTKSRLNVWNMAWNGIRERPILGWGQENFAAIYTVNRLPMIEPQVWLDRAHNIIIHWLVNAGVLGLLSYLLIFAAAGYVTWVAFRQQRIKKAEAGVIIVFSAVYLVQNMFVFDTINTYIIFFALLAFMDNLDYTKGFPRENGGRENPEKNTVRLIAAVSVLLLLAPAVIYYLNYKPAKQTRQVLQISKEFSDYGSFSALLNDFKKALSYDTFADYDVRERMLSTSLYIIKNNLFYQKGALQFIQATIQETEKEVENRYYDLQYMTVLIRFFYEFSKREPALTAFAETLVRECLKINPEYQRLHMFMADIDMLKKDYENAFVNVWEIANLDPNNDKKQFKLALAAVYTSREKIVESSLQKVTEIRTATNNNVAAGRETVLSAEEMYQLATAYKEMENYEKALNYMKELLEVLSYDDRIHFKRDFRMRRPVTRARIHLDMARMYKNIGDEKKAIHEAETVLKIAPEKFRKETENLID